jgi:hypothetical protein
MASIKIPVDLAALNISDLVPEGRHRARIASVTLYPKDKTIDPETGAIEGAQWDDGSPQYAWLRVGYSLMEHESNYGVDGRGRPVSLAGKYVWHNYRVNETRNLTELFNAAGVGIPKEGDLDGALLLNNEVDINVYHKARKDNPDVKENAVRGVRMALDVSRN